MYRNQQHYAIGKEMDWLRTEGGCWNGEWIRVVIVGHTPKRVTVRFDNNLRHVLPENLYSPLDTRYKQRVEDEALPF
jgi:hypothetical protein